MVCFNTSFNNLANCIYFMIVCFLSCLSPALFFQFRQYFLIRNEGFDFAALQVNGKLPLI